ncbi:MAG: hypothetical protein ACXVBJ_12275 [Flavisolibacter sp.]
MKRLLVLTLVLSAFVGYSSFSQKKDVSNATMQLPYKMQLNNFSFGNSLYVQKVLSYWKDYCENTMGKSVDLFTVDVLATFPDGTVTNGKEMLMTGAQQYRDYFASITCEISACICLKTPDDPQREAVTVWATETDTDKNGKVTKAFINEVYFFNKDGKVAEMHQLRAEVKNTRN